MTGEPPRLTCPSAPCAPGAQLVGILGGDGRVHNLRTPLEVDEGFVAEASRQGPPEARMRFAAPCQKSGCAQWTGEGCGVIRKVMAHLGAAAEGALPPCTIRSSCRWYAEKAAAACHVCDRVVTDQAAMEPRPAMA